VPQRRNLALINYRILALIKRELREKLMTRSFIIMTLLVPVFMFGLIGFQMLMGTYKGDKGTHIVLITEMESLTDQFKAYLSKQDFVKDGTYTLSYDTVSRRLLKKHVESRKKEVLSGKLNGIIFVPSTALQTKQVEYYSKTPNNRTVFEKLNNCINEVLIDRYFAGKNLTNEELNFVRKGVRFNGFKVSEKEGIKAEGFGKTGLAMFFSFLVYMSVIFSSGATLNSVMDEKNSKVVEVLLSSVNSRELMTGKIIGCTVTMFVQMIMDNSTGLVARYRYRLWLLHLFFH
jgi:ABC-2 type transport system permease protein